MSIRTVCSSCRKVYNLDEAMQGKTVRCRDCKAPITVPTLDRQGRRVESSRPADDRIAASTRPASAAGRANRDDEDDDKSERRPAERRARGKDKDSKGGKNLVPILIGAGVGLLVLIGLVVGGGIFLFVRMSGKSTEPAAVSTAPAAVALANKVEAENKAAVENKFDAVQAEAAKRAATPLAVSAKAPEVAVPAGPVPNEMATDMVKKVKQSTAYLRVTLPNGEVAQGSGFFALERGIVITNAHVVGMKRTSSPPRRVEIVIHSGEISEVKMAGTLLGIDRDNDLAVLRVQGDLSRLPPALPVASAEELTETQNVYIFGYPFGAELGKSISVNKSTISALRRSGGGVLKTVQVNGGMHPGNSGGPVTDARGAVVGVSVAIITGTQINFAVPSDFIRPLVLQGKNHPLDLAALPVAVARNDPMPQNDLPAGPAPGRGMQGDLAALKGTWQSGTVGADGGGAAGTIKLSINPQPGNHGGRIFLEIATKQGGRTTSSKLNYAFTLEQKGGERLLITHIRQVGRRGTVRGMVFLYRFEGNQLILTGVIASGRNAYKLQNVAMRRTSAEPEMPPAGAPATPGAPGPVVGGKKKAVPTPVKFKGDVYSFVEEAVRDKRLVDVDIRGFKLSKNLYRDIPEEGGVLIGFQVGLGKFVNNAIVKSLRPIFLTKKGEKFGPWHGPTPAAPITLKAKPGYVVSSMLVRSALSIDAITLTYAKLGKDSLDLNDTYNSQTAGGEGGNPATIGGKGALFIGATGHLGNDGSPCSLGLVAALAKD